MNEPHRLTALRAGAAIAAGQLTSVALTEACLARIAERDDAVGAWIHLDPEAALDEARKRDSEEPRSALHGVPVGVKDIIDTHDMPTCYGSPIYSPGTRPAWDASCVALLRNAGMTVLGKTVTTEFAMRHPGKTRNPSDPGRTPGGSSQGSAAGVADHQVPLAIGTQTAGSVIRPASFCGAVGYKPTFGLIHRSGVKPLSESLDTIGSLARSVEDAAAFARAMAGLPFSTVEPARARFALCRSPAWPEVQPASEAAMERAVGAAGDRIPAIELPSPCEDLLIAHDVIMAYEAARALAHEHFNHADELSEAILKVIGTGEAFFHTRYLWARDVQAGAAAAFNDIFGGTDVLITPAAPGEAPEGLGWTGTPEFNRIWTTIGAPCVTLPGVAGPNGMPVGVQLVGRPGHDDALLAAAAWLHPRLQG